jgi:hypothetical protein
VPHDSLDAALMARGELLEAGGAVPIARSQEIFHGADCRDSGTWERRIAPLVTLSCEGGS